MEFEYYEKIYQKDVNNYVAVTYDGKVKSKGAYVKKLSKLDNDLPIVNKALVDYMVKDVPIENTIFNCKELIQFQKIYKLTSNYDYVKHNNSKLFNKSYRVFASTDVNDTPIYKCKKVTDRHTEECKYINWGACGCGKYDGICPFEDRNLCDWYEATYIRGVKCDKFANTPDHAFILNTNINNVPIPTNLDKQWYVDEAYKRLEQFIGGTNG